MKYHVRLQIHFRYSYNYILTLNWVLSDRRFAILGTKLHAWQLVRLFQPGSRWSHPLHLRNAHQHALPTTPTTPPWLLTTTVVLILLLRITCNSRYLLVKWSVVATLPSDDPLGLSTTPAAVINPEMAVAVAGDCDHPRRRNVSSSPRASFPLLSKRSRCPPAEAGIYGLQRHSNASSVFRRRWIGGLPWTLHCRPCVAAERYASGAAWALSAPGVPVEGDTIGAKLRCFSRSSR